MLHLDVGVRERLPLPVRDGDQHRAAAERPHVDEQHGQVVRVERLVALVGLPGFGLVFGLVLSARLRQREIRVQIALLPAVGQRRGGGGGRGFGRARRASRSEATSWSAVAELGRGLLRHGEGEREVVHVSRRRPRSLS